MLDTLETANVPRSEGDRSQEFARWRQDAVKTAASVSVEQEPVLTSLSPVNSLPGEVRYLKHNADSTAIASALRSSGIPFSSFYQLLITFADIDTINGALPTPMVAEPRAAVSLVDFLNGHVSEVTSPRRDDAHNIATALLRQHVERHLLARGLKALPQHSSSAYYFPDGLVANNKVPYTAASGRRTNKNVVGRSERNKVHWHLAMKVSVALGRLHSCVSSPTSLSRTTVR